MERLELLSAAELGKEILARNLGPKEVVRYFADRIEAYNKDTEMIDKAAHLRNESANKVWLTLIAYSIYKLKGGK